MGFSKKAQVDACSESDAKKKWVIAGIASKASLKPVRIKPPPSSKAASNNDDESDGAGSRSTTPTAREARIPERLPCPPAPRKRRPSSNCHMSGVREFFVPPDLETVFKRHVERAN